MNIKEIKATIAATTGVPILSLDMSRQTSDDPTGTIDPITKKIAQVLEPWYSYWDNTNRLRVVMPEDIYNTLHNAKKNGTLMDITGLALKPMVVVTPENKASYRRIVIITPNIADSF